MQRQRLNAAINERRLKLGLRWVDITAAAQITDSALRAIRRGDYAPAELTARRLEDALQWEHGSIDAVLNGGQPTPVQEEQPWNFLERIERIREELDKLQRDAEEQRRRGA